VKGHDRYVWLNDSTSEGGAQEYAVLRLGLADGYMTQIESITFGWCDRAKALQFVQETWLAKTTKTTSLVRSLQRSKRPRNTEDVSTVPETRPIQFIDGALFLAEKAPVCCEIGHHILRTNFDLPSLDQVHWRPLAEHRHGRNHCLRLRSANSWLAVPGPDSSSLSPRFLLFW